jgi:hypothetical protein
MTGYDNVNEAAINHRSFAIRYRTFKASAHNRGQALIPVLEVSMAVASIPSKG